MNLSLEARGGRARAKKKTREVCSALKQRQGSSSRPSPSAERWGEILLIVSAGDTLRVRFVWGTSCPFSFSLSLLFDNDEEVDFNGVSFSLSLGIVFDSRMEYTNIMNTNDEEVDYINSIQKTEKN